MNREKVLHSERLATIGKFAGIMGHELRYPLGIIRNSVYYLNMRLKENMDDKVKKHIRILETEIDKCDKIISDVLGFASLKPPSLIKSDINYVVSESLSKLKIPKSVSVKTDLADNLPRLLIDASQIEQVFLNMISNAVEAMPCGGRLSVKTYQNGKSISILFKDTGCGIPPENLNRLFEPLFSSKAKGIGLGLAASQVIIDGHKGRIEVESKTGKGAVFKIRLPKQGR